MTRSTLSLITALTLGLCASQSALAQTPYDVEGYTVELPAPPQGSLRTADRLYVALGQRGVAVFSIDGPRATLLEVRATPGDAVDLIMLQGSPWVISSEVHATPFEGATALGRKPAMTGEPSLTPVPLAARDGAVLSSGVGVAVIDLGRNDGLKVGDTVRILQKEEVTIEGIQTSDDGLFREVASGLGEVAVLGEAQSQILLRTGSRAPVGARVERLDHTPTLSLAAPNRMGDLIDLGIVARPFLGVGTLGVGSNNELWATWIGDGPYFAEVRMLPLGLGWSKDGNVINLSATAVAGYDHRYFGVALGGGITGTNDKGRDQDYTIEPEHQDDGTITGWTRDYRSRGGTFAQVVRLGARDGLNLEVRNTFLLQLQEDLYFDCATYETDAYGESSCAAFEETPNHVDIDRAFGWGSTYARLSVPVADRTSLVIEGGGGATGYASAAAGVHTWTKGNGDVGSVGLQVSGGFGMLTGQPEAGYVQLTGPQLSFGVHWRI